MQIGRDGEVVGGAFGGQKGLQGGEGLLKMLACFIIPFPVEKMGTQEAVGNGEVARLAEAVLQRFLGVVGGRVSPPPQG